MNIADAKQQIKDTVDAYLTQDETGAYLISPAGQRPLFLLGAPGIGKTAIVEQVANELNIGLVSYSMTHHTRQSALGLPFIVEREFGDKKYQVSEYTMSEIIASVYDYMEETGFDRGILFLDEINCVSETLYPSMLQFLQFKTFGRHKVPDSWIVVCAGNPPEYNKSVHEFDVVTLDRLRKIEIEPELDAWMAYALETGVHPAVISYLDVKKNQFYSVESTPSGKTFVTARGWDDLSRIIKLFESKGKTVNRDLVQQFLQDDEISDRFAQYYALFTKYRSDYQISDILNNEASAEIKQRAKAARFDERLALIRLILDGLDNELGAAIENEQVMTAVRDVLRQAKPNLQSGASAQDAIASIADQIDKEAKHRVSLEISTDAAVRPDRLAAAKLRGYVDECVQMRAEQGMPAFAVVSARYSDDVQALHDEMQACGEKLNNAFKFIEEMYSDDKEMAAFVAELTARHNTSQFISKFGNEAYYAHNNTVLANSSQEQLMSRIESLDLEAAAQAAAEEEAMKCDSRSSNCGSCAGC